VCAREQKAPKTASERARSFPAPSQLGFACESSLDINTPLLFSEGERGGEVSREIRDAGADGADGADGRAGRGAPAEGQADDGLGARETHFKPQCLAKGALYTERLVDAVERQQQEEEVGLDGLSFSSCSPSVITPFMLSLPPSPPCCRIFSNWPT